MIRKLLSKRKWLRRAIVLGFSLFFLVTGFAALWVATLQMPDLQAFEQRRVTQSTKIYDRSGTILLYDTGVNAKRTSLKLEDISPFIKQATIAIEDANFYTNYGIEPSGILRAVFANLASGEFGQGGSTITQQVVKNSLLTTDKTPTRKFKEWVLALKLTRVLPKDDILKTYLNEISYGGTLYGVEEASQAFFGKPAKEVSLAEAAYLAALPQAPSYFSPYGSHRDALNNRQKLVLSRMKTLGMITDNEYKKASEEKVEFLSRSDAGIRSPHFVMFIREYLIEKYGEDAMQNGGFRVITTLDYSMQQKAEDIVKRFGPSLSSNFNASNTAVVAIDPKTGDILTMIGSRDYFDPSIDGNFNIALAKRQPGSTFKPFVYATAFKKGYTPETILFDTKTEFSTQCTVEGKPKNETADSKKVCYSPDEYDHIFEGPMSIRKALAQSRNIPAVKTLYLAGIQNSIETAEQMGITSLNDPNRYGLTLVLGGGEVSLLDLTSAYGVFANDGIRNPYRSILKITDSKGNILEETSSSPSVALDPEVARQISDILSDTQVRMNSLRSIGEGVGRQVAIKTGTTNDYRDVWAVGYTPNLVIGTWAGKNDNTPMKQNVAGLIIAPVWGAIMADAVKNLPIENFKLPPSPDKNIKPVLRGIWQGGVSYKIDSVSGKLATEYTPTETTKEFTINDVHNILHWVNKNDPHGPIPTHPQDDSQYEYWEYGVRKWFDGWKVTHPEFIENKTPTNIPTQKDDVHVPEKMIKVSITSPTNDSIFSSKQRLDVKLSASGPYQPTKSEIYFNGKYVLTKEFDPLNISFVPNDIGNVSEINTLSVVLYDQVFNRGHASTTIRISN